MIAVCQYPVVFVRGVYVAPAFADTHEHLRLQLGAERCSAMLVHLFRFHDSIL